MKLGFIGCGKLGKSCAEVMAEKYFVEGYDTSPVQPKNFSMVDSIEKVMKDKDIVFIAVPTPHDPAYDGREPTSHLPPKDFDYSIVKSVLTEANKFATKDQLVVLISTLLPGTTRSQLIGLINNARFIYNPYLIAMGTVEWDMVNPEMVIIGTEDGSLTGDAQILIDFYKTLMENNPRYEVGTWDEAECIKIFYNTFISFKVSFVNMIQDVAMRQGNINVDVVANALAQSDVRITGPKYLVAGLGDAGACHPRDNIALRDMAQKLNLGYDLFGEIMRSREIQAKNMADYLTSFNLPVVIVGKTYKPGVPYIDGSSSMLVGSYVEAKQKLYYFDPILQEYPPEDLGPAVYLLAHCAEVTYFNSKPVEQQPYHLKTMPGSFIVDPWRTITVDQLAPGTTLVHYGNTRTKI